MRLKMKKIVLTLITILLISACSSTPPKAKEPKGDWTQINDKHYYEETQRQTEANNGIL